MSDWQKDSEIIESATPAPWRFVQILDGLEARALLDARGYLFGRVDDLENGAFCEAARTRWPLALDRIAELEARLEKAYSFVQWANQNARPHLDNPFAASAWDKRLRDLWR